MSDHSEQHADKACLCLCGHVLFASGGAFSGGQGALWKSVRAPRSLQVRVTASLTEVLIGLRPHVGRAGSFAMEGS